MNGSGPNQGVTPQSDLSLEMTGEALRTEERSRLRVTAGVLIGMACLGMALTPMMAGDPEAKAVFLGGLLFAVVAMVWLLRNSYVSGYNANLIGLGAVSLGIANTSTLYYIGVFSQASVPGVLGLYIFCLGQASRWAAGVYATLAVPHAVLATLIIGGVVADRGLVTATELPAGDLAALHGYVQAVYALAFLAGRASRKKHERVFTELGTATRLLAQRDALLNEAKNELERAVRVGGEGRFTGQTIGSFRLGSIIGRGGMGEVYEAVHLADGDEAAVKLLHRNAFADPNSVVRFAREAKVLLSLSSPHVVRVVEIGDETSGLPYLAMERLRGEDLASVLRRERRLSARELVELAQQIGRALDAAQACGVVHRDIKPQNLFLARQESASSVWKVLDFGISKLAGQATLTRDQLVGTPEYMAPEQAAGKDVDYRADLYALAAVLFRCVASRAPFVADSLPALVHKVVNQFPPRPSSLARVSSDIDAFLAIGLAKDPSERFASGAELGDMFELAMAGQLPGALRARAERILARTPWSV